jgi:hypothetical protein
MSLGVVELIQRATFESDDVPTFVAWLDVPDATSQQLTSVHHVDFGTVGEPSHFIEIEAETA